MTKVSVNNRATQEYQKMTGEERLIFFYELCNTCIGERINDFKALKSSLAEMLEELLAKGQIGRQVQMLSRIKSPESVTQKLQIHEKIHDVFGITLLTQTQEEIKQIEEALKDAEWIEIKSKKQRSEKRGYEATHFVFLVGEEKKKTMVECHMQTYEAYKNMYPHCFYKIRRKAGRDLTKEEEMQIAEKIQSMYESGELQGHELLGGQKSNVPQMWITSFNQKGKMEEEKLCESQALKIMYPFLDLSKKKSDVPSSQEQIVEDEEQEQ